MNLTNYSPAKPLIVVPAYGSDYTNGLDALEAWRRHKDFRIQDISSKYDGAYINARDAEASLTDPSARVGAVKIRFNRKANFVIVHWTSQGWYIFEG